MLILQPNLKTALIVWVVFSTVVSYAKRCCDQECQSKYTFHLVQPKIWVYIGISRRALIRRSMRDLQPQVCCKPYRMVPEVVKKIC